MRLKHMLWMFSCAGLMAACGGDETNGSSYSVTGQLASSSYLVGASEDVVNNYRAAKVNGVAVGQTLVTQVWAVPLYSYDGDLWGNFDNAEKRDVDDNGEFSLGLDDSTDWIILLMDMTAAAKKDQVVGYVSMADIESELSMVLVPVSDVTEESESLDLGTLENEDDEAQSSVGLEQVAAELTLSLSDLQELASVDDTFKSIKNHYINYDEANDQYYFLHVGFNWVADIQSINNQAISPVSLNFSGGLYRGYTIDVETNVALPADVCDGNPPTSLAIVPPVDAPDFSHSGIDGRVYNGQNPLSNDASGMTLDYHYEDDTCVDDDFSVTIAASDDNPVRFGGPWGLEYLTGTVPTGEWSVQLDAQEIAVFDISSAYPFDSSGNPTVYLPAPNISVDNNGNITQVEVTWYRYNESAEEYVLLSDLSRLNDISNFHFIELVDYSGHSGTGERTTDLNYTDGNASTGLSSFSAGTWSFSGSNTMNDLVIDEFAIGYRMSGISYRFAYRH